MKKNLFLLTMLGTVGSLVLTAIYAVVFMLIQKGIFSLRFGDEATIAYLPYQMIIIVGAFLIFEVVFFVWLFTFMMKDKEKESKTLMAKASDKKLSLPAKIAGGVGAAALVLMVIFGTTFYTEVTKDGLYRKNLIFTEEYTWDDVYLCKLSCDENQTLTYTLQFNDGTTAQLLSNNSCSDAFLEEFGDMLTFCVYLSDKFDDKGIRTQVVGENYMQQFYGAKEKNWEQLKKIGNFEENVPN